MKYRSEIDGLRAVAVIPVILFHAGFSLFSGGFIGVDIFFVISGYLITSILIEELSTGRFSVSRFYERRARRILPALFVVVLCTYFVAWFILSPFDLKELSQSIFSVSIFSSNIYFFLKTGYFDTAAELKPLLHTWSLAVEEQYYVLFPLFLWLMWRRGKTTVFWSITALALLSLLASEWSWRNSPSANFYLLHTRAWEILAGSVAAFIVDKRGVRKNNALSIIGIMAVIFSIFAYDDTVPIPSLFGIVPVGGVVLVILFAQRETFVARALSAKPLVFIGLLSYSAYLWHQPVIVLTRHYLVDELPTDLAWLAVIVTFALAYFSWKFVETPFRRLEKTKRNSRIIFGLSSLVIAVMGVVGIAGHLANGFPARNENMLRLAQNGGLSFKCSGASVNDARCKTQDFPEIAVWGDSYAMHFVQALSTAFPEKGVQQLTLSACPPAPGYKNAPIKASVTCEDFNAQVQAFLLDTARHHIRTVFLSSSIDLTGGDVATFFTENMQALENAGLNVVLVSPTAKFAGSEKCLTHAMRGNKPLSDCIFPFETAKNASVFAKLAQVSADYGASFLDLSAFMCADGDCRLEKDGYLVLRDEGHLTNEVQPALAKFFAASPVLEPLR